MKTLHRLRRRPSPALVVACIALVVALGGTSFAAIVVTGSMIRNNSVGSIDLADNSILSRDIRNGSIYPVDLSAAAKRSMQGAPGEDGTDGAPGATGPTGPTGAQGPAGPTASVYRQDTTATNLTFTKQAAVSAPISVTVPSRLVVTGVTQVQDDSASTYAATCWVEHTPAGGSTTAVGAEMSVGANYPAGAVSLSALGLVAVAAGTHTVSLMCIGSDAQVDNSAITVIATAA